MKARILGFIVSETKTGNVGTTLYVEIEHDTYRRENALETHVAVSTSAVTIRQT